MDTWQVQSLVLRMAAGPAVAHQILRVPSGRSRSAARLLLKLEPSFGPQSSEHAFCSLGFSFAGLDALGVPDAYLRVFRRLASAFQMGAGRRSVYLGDCGASAAARWRPEFREANAHVLLSWHGTASSVAKNAREFAAEWRGVCGKGEQAVHAARFGRRLGRPQGEQGEWVHFGFRDGISDVCIDTEMPRPGAPDLRWHQPGELLLGKVNDSGSNPFSLNRAPEKVRLFFRDSSFGVLRPMRQDLAAFEDQVDRWVKQMGRVYETPLTRDFVKAKLAGRWPNGQQQGPGDREPNGSLVLDLGWDEEKDQPKDAAGEGCPFGSHVRRMRAPQVRSGTEMQRPLQRRSIPFGSAAWSGRPSKPKARGLLGHFFCASIEDQFEHLLGQWAARPPLGFSPDDSALDPFMGPHADPCAALAVPLKDRPTQLLAGFGACTTTQGTMYAWHPSRCALEALLTDDFVPDEDELPWL